MPDGNTPGVVALFTRLQVSLRLSKRAAPSLQERAMVPFSVRVRFRICASCGPPARIPDGRCHLTAPVARSIDTKPQ